MPQFINLFLPEFPIRPLTGQQPLKILGLVAKVSFGIILKVLDCGQKSVFAVKVVPKVMVLQRDTLRQYKEEVSIQKQINHPFVHCLGDSWQEKHISSLREKISRLHQFGQEVYNTLSPGTDASKYCLDFWCSALCSYCKTDLYSLWSTVGYFGRLKLTDFGLSCYLSQEARAYTICGILQCMAPEVLSGGPYNHAADWCLAFLSGNQKALMPASSPPSTISASLPVNPFFRYMAFDPELLQKQPVNFVVEAQATQPNTSESMPFKDFDCNLKSFLIYPSPV